MTEIPFKDASAFELQLRLYDGFVDERRFSVFARGRAVLEDIEIVAKVIGSSHVMAIRSGRHSLTELFACESPPAKRPLALWQPGDAPIEFTAHQALSYQFEAWVVGLERSKFELEHLRLLVEGARHAASEVGLACRFPAQVKGQCVAETLVWASVDQKAARARTAHCYPQEGLVVLSSSCVRLPAGTRPDPELNVAVGV